MNGLTELEHGERGIVLTDEDYWLMRERFCDYEHYNLSICERNDAAIMAARTVVAVTACRATRNRLMPA